MADLTARLETPSRDVRRGKVAALTRGITDDFSSRPMFGVPSLWSLLNSWEENGTDRPARLPLGAILATDWKTSSTVLIDREDFYEEQSSFLRIGANPLPLPIRRTMISHLKTLIRGYRGPTDDQIICYILANPDVQSSAWGVRFIDWYFRDIIASRRSDGINRVLSRYREEIVIPDGLRGRRFVRGTRRFSSLVQELAGELADETLEVNPFRDVVDASLSIAEGESLELSAEVLLRLYLSFVGFTGAATEWLIVLLASGWVDDSAVEDRGYRRGLVMEAQRLMPTAWRLHRVCKRSHNLNGVAVASGDDVVLASYAVHVDDTWEDPWCFRPSRWTSSQRGGHFLPFGIGENACPAASQAMDVLERFLAVSCGSFTAKPTRIRQRIPRVLTLFGPPRLELRWCPRSAGVRVDPA